MDEKTALPTSYYLRNDKNFNKLYPHSIQLMSARHWTPLHIIKYAAEFLDNGPGCKILDIGSGVGKFCLAAASYAPGAMFFGVEQRAYLIEHAVAAKEALGVENVQFMEGNFTQLNLQDYNNFYFYNSFFENLDNTDRIDDDINYSDSLYDYYVRYLYTSLKGMPSGTRVVTYHSFRDEIPREYKLVESLENGELNSWIKR